MRVVCLKCPIISGYLLPAPKRFKLPSPPSCAFSWFLLVRAPNFCGVTFALEASKTGSPNGSAFPSQTSDPPLESSSAESFSEHDLRHWRGKTRSPLASGHTVNEGSFCFVLTAPLDPPFHPSPPVLADQVLFLGPNAGRESLSESPSLEGSPSTPPNPQSRDSRQTWRMLGNQV